MLCAVRLCRCCWERQPRPPGGAWQGAGPSASLSSWWPCRHRVSAGAGPTTQRFPLGVRRRAGNRPGHGSVRRRPDAGDAEPPMRRGRDRKRVLGGRAPGGVVKAPRGSVTRSPLFSRRDILKNPSSDFSPSFLRKGGRRQETACWAGQKPPSCVQPSPDSCRDARDLVRLLTPCRTRRSQSSLRHVLPAEAEGAEGATRVGRGASRQAGQHQLALGQPQPALSRREGPRDPRPLPFAGQRVLWETLPFRLRCICLCFLHSAKRRCGGAKYVQFISERKPVC